MIRDLFITASPLDLVDILAVALFFYGLFRIFERTRTLQLLALFLILAAALLSARRLNLLTLNVLIDRIWAVFFIALVILFQPEMRRALAQFPTARFFRKRLRSDPALIHEVVVAAQLLSRRGMGALIVMERDDNLDSLVENGTVLDARLTADLLVTLFSKKTPLHDGAVLVRNGRILMAGCILPLSQRQDLAGEYGTRHRAALGLSEESDAVVVVVSEERHAVSLAIAGKIAPSLDPDTLEEMLTLYAVKSS